jgi:dTDP-glucose 4,6-dehydratase
MLHRIAERSGHGIDRVVVTGGAGFIGSHLVDGCLDWFPNAEVAVVDALTYAGNMANLAGAQASGRLHFVHADVCDAGAMRKAVKGADLVIHAAAESHVDRSFANASVFLQTNVIGTQSVMEACREAKVARVVLVSTDEVYGPREEHDEACERTILHPTNPYSASKAAAEMLALAAFKSYALPLVVIRPNNIYGLRQYPEKLIPRFIQRAMRGETLTVHGSGKQRRRFLAVEDLLAATRCVIQSNVVGEIFNIGIRDSYSVLEIIELLGHTLGRSLNPQVEFIEDRPFNDICYATNSEKLHRLGWSPQRRLRDDFDELVASVWAAHAAEASVATPAVASGVSAAAIA